MKVKAKKTFGKKINWLKGTELTDAGVYQSRNNQHALVLLEDNDTNCLLVTVQDGETRNVALSSLGEAQFRQLEVGCSATVYVTGA